MGWNSGVDELKNLDTQDLGSYLTPRLGKCGSLIFRVEERSLSPSGDPAKTSLE